MRRLLRFVALVLLPWVLTAAVAAPAPTVLGDIRFERKSKGGDEFSPAVFPHWVHRVKYKCYVCHNKEMGFALKSGSVDITMALIDDGKYCGVCHKGEPAFGISFETCNRCHRK